METLIIYFDKLKKNKQIIRPSAKFDKRWRELVYHVTHSDDFHKNYHHYEII